VLTVLGFTICLKSDKTIGVLFIFFLSAIGYGVFLEIMQAHYFSNRSSDWKDMVANTFGSCMAWLVLRRMREQHLKLKLPEEK
jgi:glycopeptide antibiotics resistance protein